MPGIKPGEYLIDDDFKDADAIFHPVINGERKGMGCVPRDYSKYPQSMFSPPSELVVYPRSEWSDRIKEQEERKSRTSDVLLRGDGGKLIPATDQDGAGYCWAYSCGGCVIALRALAGLPYVNLNPHSVAAVIKEGRDEGGWCGLSAEFVKEHGIASMEQWPGNSRDWRRLYDADCKADMAKHRVTEDWIDLAAPVYDRDLTFEQLATCLLSNIPCATDYDWWGHSVMCCDLVEVEPGDFGLRIRNSWGDDWGDHGFSVLRGSKAQPVSSLALRVTNASGK